MTFNTDLRIGYELQARVLHLLNHLPDPTGIRTSDQMRRYIYGEISAMSIYDIVKDIRG